MKQCYKCGVKNSDNCSFCGNCGAPLNEQQYNVNYQPQYQQQENTYYQPPQQSYPQQPMPAKEKKGHGCLIAMLVIVGVFVLFSFIVMLLPSEDSSNTSQNTTVTQDADITENEDGIYELNDIDLKFVSSKVVKEEYSDNYYLIVNFDYTNTSNVSQSFDYNVSLKAFQSGVELQSPISTYGIPDYDFHYSQKEIKPGVTLSVQEAFQLDDLKNTVSIEIYDSMIIISDKPDYQFDIEISE